jgi:hypothetical protein
MAILFIATVVIITIVIVAIIPFCQKSRVVG